MFCLLSEGPMPRLFDDVPGRSILGTVGYTGRICSVYHAHRYLLVLAETGSAGSDCRHYSVPLIFIALFLV